MRVFAVSGFSGRGKTSIVEAIVKTLHTKGYAVITVKSSKHNFQEEEGSDSWRHRQAGAKSTIIVGPSSTLIYHGERKALREILTGTEADYLIIEGMKESDVPKFWCIGTASIDYQYLPKSVKAVITWERQGRGQGKGIPIIDADDVDMLVAIVEKEAIDLSMVNI